MKQAHLPVFRFISIVGKALYLKNNLGRLAAAAAEFKDWLPLAAIAEEQGMAPVFYAHCQAAGIEIPVNIRRQLQGLTLRHHIANQIHADALAEILKACSAEGVEVLALGEAALAWTVYPNAGLRPIHSLGLLTRPAMKERLAWILLELSYRRPEGIPGLPISGELQSCFFKKQAGLRIMVQVQQDLATFSGDAPELDTATLIERGKSFTLEDIPARCLAPEEMLWQIFKQMISTDIRISHCADLISVAEQFAEQIDWHGLRKNQPGILTALTLLHGVTWLDEKLIQAAQLPITSPSPQFEDDFFSRLETFMAATTTIPDSASLVEWGQHLARKLILPDACQNSQRMQYRSQTKERHNNVALEVKAVLDSQLAIRQECRQEPEKAIPRIIHQTWKNAEIPEALTAYRQTWKQHHPDWTFILWTDQANRELIRQRYAWFLPIYDGYPEAIMRADAARYFILHHFGGVYIDLDFEAFRPLAPLLAEKELVFGLEPAGHLLLPLALDRDLDQIVCNAFMASRPEHPFWHHVFHTLVEYSQNPGPLDATGPFLLTRAWASYADKNRPTLIPSRLLYPISNTVIFKDLMEPEQKRIREEAFAIHHWWGGWWQKAEPEAAAPLSCELRSPGTPVRRFSPDLDSYTALLKTRTDLPLFSGLMVTKNRPRLAERAIHWFLGQTYPAKELVILDDGEDDRLENLVANMHDPRLRFFRIPSAGKTLGELRNLALERARGEFVGQWDDDDLSAPQRLEIQMAALLFHQVDACLLQRHMIWYPRTQRLAISNVRLWESSFICRKTKVPVYPPLSRGEDTPVIEQISRGNYLWLDYPQLYIYTFHGRNTFDSSHFEEFWQAATQFFEKNAYWLQLEVLSRRMGIDLTAIGERGLEEGQGEEDSKAGAQEISGEIAEREEPRRINKPAKQTGEAISPTILILIPVKDAVQHLPGCLHNLLALTFPHAEISLGFLESDSRDGTYSWLTDALPILRREFRRATLIKRDYGYRMEGSRWAMSKQRKRREILARSRNYLLSQALRDEDWVLWLDVDVARYPADVLEMLLSYGKEITVPNCLTLEGNQQYDLNTYKLKSEAAKIDWQPYIVDDLLQPPAGLARWYLNDLSLFDTVEVDAVGGTMLLVKADLHREGLIFPPFPYRHTIETEGLTAMANDMGYRCWGLPKVVIHHPM